MMSSNNPSACTIFQYPRADRGECNLSNIIVKLNNIIPFSILVQIVGSATKADAVMVAHDGYSFSILVQIVGSATA